MSAILKKWHPLSRFNDEDHRYFLLYKKGEQFGLLLVCYIVLSIVLLLFGDLEFIDSRAHFVIHVPQELERCPGSQDQDSRQQNA